ncbi:hypothetical protein PVAND_003771 [Polypedilum vanderplanki]|uniref:Uncharacterized protein n=1 Tax=Polypedilum vanderplanki TaxID=319348 RepID=A0A9J6BV22_POLVA|nr:hypothetical protein PVAND_003771 [Polypedilum vanderplanki]
MPSNSNSVYQPTTVTNTFIAQTSSSSRPLNFNVLKRPWVKILLLIGGLFFLAVGIVIFGLGTIDFEDSQYVVPNERNFDVLLIIFGLFFAILGLVLLGIYVKVMEFWRHHCIICPCSNKRKHRLVQLQGHNDGNHIMALNPSTDPLVSHTQYELSVSDAPIDEERKKLMENKEFSIAEEGQMDPRIILKPSQ